MNKLFITLIFSLLSFVANAQDSTTFKGYLYNEEYQVYIQMNFYSNDILVPGQEIFGKLPGFFGANRDSRKWLFTKATITDPNTAMLEITNDYGSEDLTATLKKNDNGTFTLTQNDGSALKIAVNRKWVKIPKSTVFTKVNNR